MTHFNTERHVRWLVLLILIWEVLHSNIGNPEVFHGFYQSFQANAGKVS
jgi:hypothetical protein